jgi:hypothetical protein
MPIVMGGGRIPIRLAEGKSVPVGSFDTSSPQIALINNMPDPALEDAELQFFEQLDAAPATSRFISGFIPYPRFPEALGAGSTSAPSTLGLTTF